MITLKEFKKDMEWSTMEINGLQQRDIYNAIQDETYSSLEELENDYNDMGIAGDFTIMNDVGLVALLENLNDVEPDQLVDMINAQYGNVIELYYLKDDEQYAMAIGVR